MMNTAEKLLISIDNNWQVTFEHPESRVTHTIPMGVPGNFALDLAAAGLIKFEEIMPAGSSEKIRLFEKVAKWHCRTTFNAPLHARESKVILVFNGIDTIAEIKLNGKLLGRAENMFIRHRFDVTDKLRDGANELEVIITDPVRHAETMELDALAYWTPFDSFTNYIRRTRCLMSWDNAPRLLTGGLWRSVELIEKAPFGFDDCYIYTRNVSKDLKTANVGIHFFVDFPEEKRCSLTGKITISFDGREALTHDFEVTRHYYTFHNFELNDPELWWPRGYGKANLYDVKLELFDNGKLLAARVLRTGIRFVIFNYCDMIAPDGSGEFIFHCNHQKIYCRGTNWKPIDAIYSRITPERLRQALDLAIECNCNMVRVWGGGIYEEQSFFDYCDEQGLAVWQDFMMACEFPLQSEENQLLMAQEAKAIIKELRNHPSLFLWCGDNEVDKGVFRPVRFPDSVVPSDNIITRRTLPDMIKRFDPFRFYLPSSPYICDALARDREGDYQEKAPSLHLYVDHSIYHASLRRYPSRLLAETGPIGFSAFSETPAIVEAERERFERLWDAQAPASNPPGCGHQSDIYFTLCTGKIKAALKYEFGRDFKASELDTIAPAINFTVAEVFKDAIEYYRMNKWQRTGVIWWSLLDMWQMMFNYSVVDSEMKPKLPFYWIKQSQQDICFMFDRSDDGTIVLRYANDTLEAKKIAFKIYSCDPETGKMELIAENTAQLEANASGSVIENLNAGNAKLLLAEWENGGKVCYNHFVAAQRPYSTEFFDDVRKFLSSKYNF